jgi:hypothetical protein
VSRAPVIVIALSIGIASGAAAQGSPTELHKHVSEFIATNAPRTMPRGDTLLSWNGNRLVLFHTASRDDAGVHAGLLRADRMLGIADVRWEHQAPASFLVQWRTPTPTGADSLVIEGAARADSIIVKRTGHRDTTLATPHTRWAVADYGMEELLLPLFDGPSSAPAPALVLRPYALKWDTLMVSLDPPQSTWRVARWTDRSGERWTATVEGGAHLLWVRRSDHPNDEKLPLDGSALDEKFDRLRTVLEPASRPSPSIKD